MWLVVLLLVLAYGMALVGIAIAVGAMRAGGSDFP
jgi:hypothetical protein